MIELMFLKKLMLMKQVNRKSAAFVTIDIFLDKNFKFQPNVYNGSLNIAKQCWYFKH